MIGLSIVLCAEGLGFGVEGLAACIYDDILQEAS